MPLLTRMVGVPLAVHVGSGAVSDLGALLADCRISTGGRVAVAVGPGQGANLQRTLRPLLPNADIWTVDSGSVEAAQSLATRLRGGFFDAVVGVGGGRLLDTVKWAATLTGLPMIAVATNLAHDGIASPVASLEQDGRKSSFGVQMPLAVLVDLDYVRASPVRMRRSGIGDVLSNLSAVADWELAAGVRGEQVDGIAVVLARSAALGILHRADGVDDDDFLAALAEGLVLSGLSMAVAGSSRPCSGGDHEILHAIEHLYPGTSNHGELAGLGALFTTFLRGDPVLFAGLSGCLARHDMPRTPAEVGLTDEQFTAAVLHAPETRPDRYTILEHRALRPDEVRDVVQQFLAAVRDRAAPSAPDSPSDPPAGQKGIIET